MTQFWIEQHKKFTVKENEVHSHAPADRAQLFHSVSAGATEWEYLSLLHSIVLAAKPGLVLETGTYTGMGTLAIASALQFNGFGKLVTVDTDACDEARTMIRDSLLDQFVDFRTGDSVETICNGAPCVDIAFLDSDMNKRHIEADLLIENGMIVKGGLIIFHDTSKRRWDSCAGAFAMREYCKRFPRVIEFPLSRGLTIIQL